MFVVIPDGPSIFAHGLTIVATIICIHCSASMSSRHHLDPVRAQSRHTQGRRQTDIHATPPLPNDAGVQFDGLAATLREMPLVNPANLACLLDGVAACASRCLAIASSGK